MARQKRLPGQGLGSQQLGLGGPTLVLQEPGPVDRQLGIITRGLAERVQGGQGLIQIPRATPQPKGPSQAQTGIPGSGIELDDRLEISGGLRGGTRSPRLGHGQLDPGPDLQHTGILHGHLGLGEGGQGLPAAGRIPGLGLTRLAVEEGQGLEPGPVVEQE